MTIGYNLSEFYGKPVEDFDPHKGLENPKGVAYRFRLDWSAYEAGETLDVQLSGAIEKEPEKAAQIEALVIGCWSFEMGGSDSLIDTLVKLADKLPSLEALMFGDITYEEQEISWIEQSDVGPLVMAFPDLLHFRVRGGNGLGFSNVKHDRLKTLIVETGGLSTATIRDIVKAELPELEHLELWLGSANYGFEASTQDLRPIFDANAWPNIEYLGLRDSEIADEIAEALAPAKGAESSGAVLDRIKVLDLSMGTLTDRGAEALLGNPKIQRLEKLDLHYHYMSDHWMDKFRELEIQVDVSDQQEDDDPDYRYVAVSE